MITVHLFWLSLHSTLTQWMLTGMELKDGLTTQFALSLKTFYFINNMLRHLFTYVPTLIET